MFRLYPENRDAIKFTYEPGKGDPLEFKFQVLAESPGAADTTAVLHMALILWAADIPQPWIEERGESI